MFKILHKEILSKNDPRIIRLVFESRDIARRTLAGQFVIIIAREEGERIPLTIVDADSEKGTVTIIYQEAGFTTRLLGGLKTGDKIHAVVGPLGHATEIKKYGTVVAIGGGVGIAEILPVTKALKATGNKVISIIGAKTLKALILQDDVRAASDTLMVATDDGSYGRKGFVTDVLCDLLDQQRIDLVYAVGPMPMMKRVAQITKAAQVRTLVSLNTIMVDGSGMCGCCRVSVGGRIKFSCVDGPEFDAHAIDWDEISRKNALYADKEKHICRINKMSNEC